MKGEDQVVFDDWLTWLLIIKVLSMLYNIAQQTMTDIFFIDWEPPRHYTYASNMRGRRTVSPWRRMFLANEFNELQSQKHIPSGLVLIVFLALMEGLGMKNYANVETSLSTATDLYAPKSFLMSSVVIIFVIFLVGALFYIGSFILGFFFPMWFPVSYVDFIDLCSLANFSIMIFDEDLKGYYIHG